ncbi:acyl-CoA reductase [Rhodococcus rhodochrous]|uniref:Acyl-CoA reductase n=1 Tax=Rhodococcus rhodochrous KG-21 TaxID=1441923 RepID=A0A0M9WPI4_RHORH|nr:acyl-CoA reductase [Rhodococcus rhodochrous]KOS56697.1 long-chain-fatty-acyl-CoA reductase [Rhodococcus rhodochrous KG-21]
MTTSEKNTTSVSVPHFVKGEVQLGSDLTHGRGEHQFSTPALDLNQIVWTRQEPGPAFDVPVDEIIDLLVEVGNRISQDPDGAFERALGFAKQSSPLPSEVVERSYHFLPNTFNRRSMEFQIANELGGIDVLDGWRQIADTPSGRVHHVRAFPPRLIHVIAGNAPGVAALSIVRGALIKGLNLIKIPSNDLFTAPAILQALAAVAPGHPVTRSFSAAYWRGGDERVEGTLFRPQFFDKLVAWGGGSTIANAQKYIGPGFELVAFDPKTSISLIGREAFDSDESLARAADLAAADATLVEQQACASSRFQFVEGTTEQVDRYCALLRERMAVERPTASAAGRPLPSDLREEIEGLRGMDDFYRVWGDYSGSGVVIRSDDPVDFHPDSRTVNVVPVSDLREGVDHANVATQTVGVFPPARKVELRDSLAAMGVQRIVNLGAAGGVEHGLPHDGFMPLTRFVRWVNDEG